jgi:hypothetical protein
MSFPIYTFAHNTFGKADCGEIVEKTSFLKGFIAKSAAPVGMVVGGASDILITCLGCATGVMPELLRPWLPLANEIANVAAGSTGKKWLYAGPSKSLADGIALGAIAGHTLSATVSHGPLAGGITLLSNLGITYWFPNKYLEPIMHKTPELISKSASKAKNLAKSGPGQALIGVSVIVVLEQLLKHSANLALMASNKTDDEKKDKMPELSVNQALAAFLLDAKNEKESDSLALPYILGFGSKGSEISPAVATKISEEINSERFSLLLSESEKSQALKRLDQLVSR